MAEYMTLPPEKLVKDVLDGMLGRETTLKHSDTRLSPIDAVGGMVAAYCDDAGKVRAIAGWSVAAGAYVGGCLGLIPPATTEEMVTERYLNEDVAENLGEVCNVLAGTFEQAGSPHVRLLKTYQPSAKTPPDMAIFLYQHVERIDFDIEVPTYGTGKMAVVIFG
jgi:hypothetical protein